MPQRKLTYAEHRAIRRIARRAIDTIQELAAKGATRVSIAQEIEACHLNGTPLELERLLAANDFSFAHDVVGIHKHLDRATGALSPVFCPRTMRRQAA